VSLEERLVRLGHDLVERESQHKDSLAAARADASRLHGCVSSALERFNATVRSQAPQLMVSVSDPRIDDKHLHAVQFELARGRHRAIITVKSRGEVTLVGPFRTGKTEGPCHSLPIDAETEIQAALGDFLAEFIEAAASP
jgi:hypothetical protein